MVQPCLNTKWSLPYFQCSILVMSLAISGSKYIKNEADKLALLDFKSKISEDPFQATASWNNSLHCCNWTGITCSASNERVVILDLRLKNLLAQYRLPLGTLRSSSALIFETMAPIIKFHKKLELIAPATSQSHLEFFHWKNSY